MFGRGKTDSLPNLGIESDLNTEEEIKNMNFVNDQPLNSSL